jgi:hypothetical protein
MQVYVRILVLLYNLLKKIKMRETLITGTPLPTEFKSVDEVINGLKACSSQITNDINDEEIDDEFDIYKEIINNISLAINYLETTKTN